MSLWHCVVLFPRSTHTPIKGLTFAQKTISLLSLRMLTQSLIVPLLISNSVDNLKHFTETRAVSNNDDYCYKAIRTETINSSNKFQLQVYKSCMKYDEMLSSEQSQVFFNRIFSDSCLFIGVFCLPVNNFYIWKEVCRFRYFLRTEYWFPWHFYEKKKLSKDIVRFNFINETSYLFIL